jgi:hypothetical protein
VDKTLAARRLSAAVGVQIRPTAIECVGKDGMVKLTNGMLFCLAGGNAAYKGGVLGDTADDYEPGFWIRNGKVWNMQEGEKIRPLPGMKSHPFE